MRLRALIGAALTALIFLTGIGVAPVAAATTYTDPQGRFSFSVPDGYTPVQAQLTAPVVAGFVSPDPGGANFTVQVREATGTLDAATAELQKRYATGTDSEPGPGGIQQLTLGGKPAQRFDYFTNAQGSRFHIMQVVAIANGAQFILIFTAQEGGYDALISQTGVVISSFAFLGASAPVASAAPVSNGSAVYGDPNGRFSFTVPIDFQSADPGEATLRFNSRASNGNLAAYFYMFVDNAPDIEGAPFNALVRSQRDFLTVDRKYTILSEQAITLGGQPAFRFDVTKTYEEDGSRVRSAFVFAPRGTTYYQITWVSTLTRFDEYAGRLQAFLSSFSFNATPNPVTPPSAPSPASPTTPKPSAPAPPSAPPPSAPPPSGSPATPPPGRDNG